MAEFKVDLLCHWYNNDFTSLMDSEVRTNQPKAASRKSKPKARKAQEEDDEEEDAEDVDEDEDDEDDE